MNYCIIVCIRRNNSFQNSLRAHIFLFAHVVLNKMQLNKFFMDMSSITKSKCQESFSEEIDFVVSWVDGNDPAWQKKRNQYRNNKEEDFRVERYRDWGLLKYWFRGVESFAPWVRKIHFICDQDPPDWLNLNHPKLHIVYHKDYIPEEYLPTFSSHPIELNCFRIPELSDKFVYFCDDMYVIQRMKPSDFFRKGLPVDCAALNPLPSNALSPDSNDKRIFYIPLNDTEYLNREFDFRTCIRKNPGKWYNIQYGNYLIRNIVLSFYSRFVGFFVFHLGQPYLKSSFEEAWRNNADILDETCRHHFRDDHDVSQSFIRYRQLAEGNFIPGKPINHAVFHISENNQQIVSTIRNQKFPMICLNDGAVPEESFESIKAELIESFDSILPHKSEFEL